jgi:hypothetical protein
MLADRLRPTPGGVIAVLAILYAIGAWTGFGNDVDTYLMIRSGQGVLLDGTYTPSRPPGYLLPEIVIGATALTGSHLPGNAVSVALAIATLLGLRWLFSRIFEPDQVACLLLLIGLNPYFAIAASSSMDHVYSLGFAVIGTVMLEQRRWPLAVVLLGFAIGARLSNVVVVAIICAYYLWMELRERGPVEAARFVAVGGLVAAAGALFYVPSFVSSDYTFAFLTYYIGDWSWFDHLARFVYKNLLLFGLPLLAAVAVISVSAIRRRPEWSSSPALIFAGIGIVAQEILYFRVPLDPTYLLPVVVTGPAIWMHIAQPSAMGRAVLVGCAAIHALVVNVDLLEREYDETGQEAIAAEVGLFLRPGLVVADWSARDASFERYREKFAREGGDD